MRNGQMCGRSSRSRMARLSPDTISALRWNRSVDLLVRRARSRSAGRDVNEIGHAQIRTHQRILTPGSSFPYIFQACLTLPCMAARQRRADAGRLALAQLRRLPFSVSTRRLLSECFIIRELRGTRSTIEFSCNFSIRLRSSTYSMLQHTASPHDCVRRWFAQLVQLNFLDKLKASSIPNPPSRIASSRQRPVESMRKRRATQTRQTNRALKRGVANAIIVASREHARQPRS